MNYLEPQRIIKKSALYAAIGMLTDIAKNLKVKDIEAAIGIEVVINHLKNDSNDLEIPFETNRAAAVLLKGDDYEIACPDNDDVWYNLSEIEESEDLKRIIGERNISLLKSGKIDYVVCRGNW